MAYVERTPLIWFTHAASFSDTRREASGPASAAGAVTQTTATCSCATKAGRGAARATGVSTRILG